MATCSLKAQWSARNYGAASFSIYFSDISHMKWNFFTASKWSTMLQNHDFFGLFFHFRTFSCNKMRVLLLPEEEKLRPWNNSNLYPCDVRPWPNDSIFPSIFSSTTDLKVKRLLSVVEHLWPNGSIFRSIFLSTFQLLIFPQHMSAKNIYHHKYLPA